MAIAAAIATFPFPMPWAVFGGALVARWGGLGMNRPAHPAVMGDDPGSASGAEAADATPAAAQTRFLPLEDMRCSD